MTTACGAALLLSALLFLYYGLLCLFSDGMKVEFQRFGLSPYRRLTGGLEVLGAIGLLAGVFLPGLILAASAGLALLMILGIMTRIRVGDSFPETLPAGILLLVNLFILACAWPGAGAP
jgi:uncharacterized membrane protein YphA (DoxX/SURF4 family)